MSDQHEYKGVKFTITRDTDPIDPRKDFDHTTVMACEHGRYSLGDEGGTALLTEAIRNSTHYRDSWENPGPNHERYYLGDATTPEGISKMLPKCRDIAWLPLYLYDHSGITMSTSQFSCRFDSGQVGFIFITKEQAIKDFGEGRWFKKLEERVLALLRAEVEEYDAYLRGEIYGYTVGDDDGWGYYGEEAAIAEVHGIIDKWSDEERAAFIANSSSDENADEEDNDRED